MAEQYLMSRGISESMNVPAAKLQEYLDDGWKVVEKKSTSESVTAEKTAEPKAKAEAKVAKESEAKAKAEEPKG